MDLNSILMILVGIVLFIFGIENFSSEIQRSASSLLNKILKKATENKWLGAFYGFLTTALVNSSTATTLMAVSLVNAGFISFVHSLPLIFGANIGSTITAQLVAFKITSYASIFLIFGFLLSFFRKTKFLGKSIFYFGLIFFSLDLISFVISPLSKDPRTLEVFSMFKNFYALLFLGFIFTLIFNSSALTIGIIIVLASKGFFSLENSFPLILGANLGTTISTLIASIRMDLYARRLAFAHFLFNFLGVILILPFINPFLRIIPLFGGGIERQIANAHFLFNVLAAIVFLLFLKPFKRFVEILVRGKEEEILLSSKFISEEVPKENKEAFSLVEKEIKNFIETDKKILFYSKEFLSTGNEKYLRKVEKLLYLSNVLNEMIGKFLFSFSIRKLNEKEAKKILYLVRISNSLEQLGDFCGDFAFLPDKLKQKNLKDNFNFRSIKSFFNKFDFVFDKLIECFPKKISSEEVTFLHSKKIVSFINEQYSFHSKNLEKEDFSAGSFFVEAVSITESLLFKIRELFLLCEEYSKIRE